MNTLVQPVPADEIDEQEAKVKEEATPNKSSKKAQPKAKPKTAAAPAKKTGKRSRGK